MSTVSEERSIDPLLAGNLWSFLRSTLTQGEDIMHDYEHRGYEEKSARLDAAARERVDKLLELLQLEVANG